MVQIKNINIISANDVSKRSLFEFYNKAYPLRGYDRIWDWVNRPSFFGNRTPVVIVQDGDVIAHAGMIPIYVQLNNKQYTASWFVDFAVLPEFQKKGLGTIIAAKWMEYADISVEIGHNEGSGAVFKKLGWIGSADSYLIHYFLRPFDYYKFSGKAPLFLRKTLNALSLPFLDAIYRKYASPADALTMNVISAPEELLDASAVSSDTVLPVRDPDYVKWRLLESPAKEAYRFFHIAQTDIRCVIKLSKGRDHDYIELLWISDSSRYPEIRKVISSLAVWGMQNGYSYIRQYTSNKGLSDYLAASLKGLVNNPGFMFYSKDPGLSEKLKSCQWHWQMIDNDFEAFKI